MVGCSNGRSAKRVLKEWAGARSGKTLGFLLEARGDFKSLHFRRITLVLGLNSNKTESR